MLSKRGAELGALVFRKRVVLGECSGKAQTARNFVCKFHTLASETPKASGVSHGFYVLVLLMLSALPIGLEAPPGLGHSPEFVHRDTCHPQDSVRQVADIRCVNVK